MQIGTVRIDDPLRPYVIAELSGNHGQKYVQAERLVAAAAEAGADAIKVQTFDAEDICADIPLPIGQNAAADAWFARLGVTRMRELFSKGGFPRKWHKRLKRFAARQGVEFLSTPFSFLAARFLVEEIGVNALKIASGDLTFQPLLDYAARRCYDVPILLSTGGATVEECYAVATSGAMYGALTTNRLALLHCVSIYPCPDIHANLRAIGTIQERFRTIKELRLPVMGWSDHTLDASLVPALAVACGATLIEKHIRLEEDTTSIDVAHSLTPSQFRTMVDTVRHAAEVLGYGHKPDPGELHDRLWGRRDPSDWLRPTKAAREGAWE